MANFRRNRRPTVPGEILVEHYMVPNNLTVTALARELGVSRKHLSDIVHGHVRITPAMAVRLAKVLGTSPTLWVNLQATLDIYDAEREFAAGGRRATG